MPQKKQPNRKPSTRPNKEALVRLLEARLSAGISESLVRHFLNIRRDVVSRDYERTSPGKFVEDFIRALMELEGSAIPSKLDVDQYLRSAESRNSGLDDGLRICATRILRAMYSIRSKRNIAHTGSLDPNLADLRFLLAAAQWCLSELLRNITGQDIDAFHKALEFVGEPVVDSYISSAGGTSSAPRLSIEEQLLLALRDRESATADELCGLLNRRKPDSIKRILRGLWKRHEIEGDPSGGYWLNDLGAKRASAVIDRIAA